MSIFTMQIRSGYAVKAPESEAHSPVNTTTTKTTDIKPTQSDPVPSPITFLDSSKNHLGTDDCKVKNQCMVCAHMPLKALNTAIRPFR